MDGSFINLLKLSGCYFGMMFILSFLLGHVSKSFLYVFLIGLGSFLALCSIQTWQGEGYFYYYVTTFGGGVVTMKYVIPVFTLIMLGKGLFSFFSQFFSNRKIWSTLVGTAGLILFVIVCIALIRNGFPLPGSEDA